MSSAASQFFMPNPLYSDAPRRKIRREPGRDSRDSSRLDLAAVTTAIVRSVGGVFRMYGSALRIIMVTAK
jgi:hypothetical protein